MKRTKHLQGFWILCFVLLSQVAFSQVTTASMSGRIYDAKKQGIPGATVVAVHQPSGTQYGATTSEKDGSFNMPNMRIGGPYTVEITAVGYNTIKKENVFLSLGQNLSISQEMKEENTEISGITVTGKKDPIFNADRTGAATNITSTQLMSMPTISRNFTDMTRLVPQSSGTNFGGRNNLFNNLSIDGSIFNNSFGLGSLPGGQTNSQPISLDALEEIQVNIAPYDVRQSGFTGAGINAVTRSGTNDFKGSAYYFFRNNDLVADKVGDTEVPVSQFDYYQAGLRIGGPIIKNKLFFFVSAELEKRTDPIGTFIADRGQGGNVSALSGTDADELSSFLATQYGYNTGAIDGYDMLTESQKILARLDWNVTKNTRANLRYTYLKSYRDVPMSNSGAQGTRQNSATALPFQNGNYNINNNYNSVVAEINSTIGNKYSNNLILGWTGFRDFRGSKGGTFPFVDIENGSNQTLTSFGYELFTANNVLDSDVFQFSDNFTIYKGKHTITLGTANEYYKFKNGFMPSFYSRYRFANLNDFYNSAPAGTETPIGASTGAGRPTLFEYRYSATTEEVPFARFEAAQVGFYAQDEWKPNDRIKVTMGIRADVPFFPKSPVSNPAVDNLTFANQEKLDVNNFPKAQVLVSPRVGFNWDVFGDRTLQVRGGTGVFTGRVPFVWMSNQASNTGALFGTISASGSAAAAYQFSPNPFEYKPADAVGKIPASYEINLSVENFKFPQVWRSNLGSDYTFAEGLTASFDLSFTKDINAAYVRNANLVASNGVIPGDGRLKYPGYPTSANARINSNITNAYVLDNSSQGWSAAVTAQLQKQFEGGWFTSLAYNFGPSWDINSGLASTSSSFFVGNAVVGNPNDPTLSYSANQQLHRVIASASWKKEYAKYFATGISIFVEARSGSNFSYTVGGDLNGDGVTGNDLMYIPRSKEEIILAPTNSSDTRTPDQIWSDLNAYITQDDYLNENRGKFAERNGAQSPWVFKSDLRITQDFKFKKNTLQLTMDIFNFGNLISPYWGVVKTPIRTQLINFVGYESVTGRPVYTYSAITDSQTGKSNVTFQNATNNFASQWQMQFGIRYIFE
ncbi:MAG: carboxypeptidase regulatory-like domain-containing protein [Thermonemataceae bacterium]|nr:carboxypeptidase regulatory-like domain-containing protein [Thermonemataceae bacterium]